MKRGVLTCVAVVACVALLGFMLSPVLGGPPSGGRSHGANSWDAKYGGGYAAPVYAAPAYTAPAISVAPAPAINGGYYYAPEATPGAGNTAVLAVQVPENAEVWLNDYKTKLTGRDREYVSPPLTGDMSFRYHVRVRWMENGQPIVQERDVSVAPGARTSVRFGG